MQPNFKKAIWVIGGLLIGASNGVIAASQSFDVTVTTLPDVTLSEITPLDFGANLYVNAGGACLMNAATPGDTPAGLMQYDDATLAASGYGDLSGGGCINGSGLGTPGVYKIAGVAGATVNVTISGVTGADFSFTPNSGCIVNYDNTAAADTCDAFVPGVSIARELPLDNVSESPVTAGSGTTIAGELVFTVGGTITVGGADLTANSAYTENFTVDVVY